MTAAHECLNFRKRGVVPSLMTVNAGMRRCRVDDERYVPGAAGSAGSPPLVRQPRGAIARQAEAERERRAKMINAEGEAQAAEKLLEAAQIMSRDPGAMQLRYLSSLNIIAGEKNSTIIFPFPMELA